HLLRFFDRAQLRRQKGQVSGARSSCGRGQQPSGEEPRPESSHLPSLPAPFLDTTPNPPFPRFRVVAWPGSRLRACWATVISRAGPTEGYRARAEALRCPNLQASRRTSAVVFYRV